jgi:hypothetical protein
MPEMQSIDMPTESGKAEFTRHLTDVLRELITDISDGTIDSTPPDTSGITWAGVAERILDI